MRSRLVWASVLAVSACGAPSPSTVTQKPIAPAMVPPAPPRAARWDVMLRPSKVADVLEIAPGLTLQVGEAGRRVLVSGDHATDAETLAPEALVGAMRDATGAFVFLGQRGDVFVSRDALGELGTVRKAPHDGELVALARGRASIVAILPDGKLVRSTDWGASYQPVETSATGRAVSVALDRNGNGVLVHLPQRVLVTHDDGATWAPIAAPVDGARRAIHDESDRVFVQGFAQTLSRLEGDAFAVAGRSSSVSPSSPALLDVVTRTRVFAGDRVVELDKTRGIAIRTGRVFEKPHETPVPAELPKDASVRLASDGAAVYLLAETADEVTLFASTDFGATWTTVAKLDGADRSSIEPFAAGPKGWLYVPGKKRRVRAAGSSTFEERTATETFDASAFAFDERNDKVYALGRHEQKKAIYEARLSQTTFAPIALALPDDSWVDPVLSVDDAGTLHVLTYDSSKYVYRVQRRDVHGLELPTLYLPFRKMTSGGNVVSPVFAGHRGLLAFGDAWAWETADSGEHWTRVGSPGSFVAQCSAAGCLADHQATMRIGWDLPAISTRGADVIEAVTEIAAPKEPRADHSQRITFAAPPPMKLECKPAGAAVTIPWEPSFETLGSGEARWAFRQDEKDGAVTMVIGERAGLRRARLLPAPPRAPETTERAPGFAWDDAGYVVGRFTRATSSGQAPWSAELAWYSFAAGKSFSAKLPSISATLDRHESIPGIQAIIEGGMVYRPDSAGPTFFLHEDGRVEELTLPPHATIEKTSRWGKQWLLVDRDDGMALVSWSLDDGKTWSQRAWATGESRAEVLFTPPSAWLAFENDAQVSVLPLAPLPPSADVPAAKPFDFSGAIDGACDPKAPWSSAHEIDGGDTVRADLALKTGNVELVASKRLARFTSAPSLCNAGYVLHDKDRKHATVVHRDRDWTGWTFDKLDHGHLATPIACATR